MRPDTLEKLRTIHKLLGEVIANEEQPTIDKMTEEEVAMCRAGRPIDAIKAMRNRTGLGLREVKDLVEAEGDKLGLRVPDSLWGHRWLTPNEQKGDLT